MINIELIRQNPDQLRQAIALRGVDSKLADVDRFCVQGGEAARRLEQLGADPVRITVTGSLKFDALDVAPTPGRSRARVLRFFRMAPIRYFCRVK